MRLFAIALAAALSLAGIAQSQAAEVKLRFNLWVPPTHHTHTQMMVPWAKEVARVTQGRVKVEFTSSSLGPPPRQFDLAARGIADVTFGDHAYSPGRFFATKIVELPFRGSSAEALSVAHWRIYSSLPQAMKEHQGAKLLSVFTHGPAGIMTTKKAVDSLDALKGLKIRVPGEISSKIVGLMGGTPVPATIRQIFGMLAKGVVDGSTFNIDGYKNFRLTKFMKFVTTVPDGLYNVSFFLVMNSKSWNRISPQDQKAIMSVSGEAFARKVGQVWDREDKLSIALMKKNGVKITPMTGAFLAKVRKLLAPLEAEWVAKANAQGLDGKALLTKLRSEYEREHKKIMKR
jgi:TRAP-type C4-dicarboxylate transport system substrate-binding protein